MNTATTTSPGAAYRTAPKVPKMPASARSALKLLENLRFGALTLMLPDGTQRRFGEHPQQHSVAQAPYPCATLTLHNWNVFGAALKSGDIGFAESFIAGDWSTPNLTELLKLFCANRREVEAVVYGTWAGRLLYRIKHLLKHNSRANSRKNIHAHYDLGNAFYSLWLDPSMNYSSAWFQREAPASAPGQTQGQGHSAPTQTPTQADFTAAQHAKVRRVLNEAGVTAGSRVLEIGCGWGALAEMAAGTLGAHVTGVTLSTEQLAFAQDRLARAGCTTLADLRLQDYRDIADGPYDAIASVEMVEAVGQAYWPTYFATVSRLLKPGGKACIQSIVIKDHLFERYLKSTDFIQQYIFPGGCLPSPQAFRQQAQAQGLTVVNELAFGLDYADTCRIWRQRFLAHKDEVLALGFDERFVRIWEFYLAYCEAGFRTGDIDVMQFTLAKH